MESRTVGRPRTNHARNGDRRRHLSAAARNPFASGRSGSPSTIPMRAAPCSTDRRSRWRRICCGTVMARPSVLTETQAAYPSDGPIRRFLDGVFHAVPQDGLDVWFPEAPHDPHRLSASDRAPKRSMVRRRPKDDSPVRSGPKGAREANGHRFCARRSWPMGAFGPDMTVIDALMPKGPLGKARRRSIVDVSSRRARFRPRRLPVIG